MPSGNLHAEVGPNPKPQELCKQRRERGISPSSLRSSGLNLHNQLDVPCISGIPEQTTNHPKIEAMDFGSNCRLRVCFLHIICFWFYVYPTLEFTAYYHWQICLLILLLSFLYIYIFSPFFSFCESVCACFLLCFCLYSFDFTIYPSVLSVHFCFCSIVFNAYNHWWICLLVSLLSSFFLSFL